MRGFQPPSPFSTYTWSQRYVFPRNASKIPLNYRMAQNFDGGKY